MDQWEQLIVEWINCLDVLYEPLKSTAELENGVFYVKILNLISRTNPNHDCNQEDIIKLIEDLYPSFKINKNDSTEHIYIASLLLMHTSQATIFHTSMCNKLKHETQIKIKTFLENVLPLEHDITKETLKEVIMEIEEETLKTPNRLRTPFLKDFIESPVVRSARSSYKIMTERTQELRKLRCELDMERFKNAELQDDVKVQQDKIRNLKAKLEEKSALLKSMREERMRPSTPQHFHKRSTECEDYYKKYIDDMEIELKKQLDKVDNLESERDNLSKTLASVRRQSAQYKENFENSERSLETLSRDMEAKDRELIELTIYNEELRELIRESNKNSARDGSFRADDSALISFPNETLNHSEILSSVIEIQLQEAKEEVVVLHTKIDSLKEELATRTKDYNDALEINESLQQKVKVLDEVRAEMSDVRKELDASNMNIANLQAEKMSFVAQNENLKNSLSSTQMELCETVQLSTTLSSKLDKLKVNVENLNELLGNERIDSSDLSITIEQIRSQVVEHLEHIRKLTDERESYKSSIKTCTKTLKDAINYGQQFIPMEIVIEKNILDHITLNDLTKYFDTILRNCHAVYNSDKKDIEELKAMINKINADLRDQKLIIANLEEQNQRILTELSIVEEEKKQQDLFINEQRETIHKYTEKIEVLKEIENEKYILEKDMLTLKEDFFNQQLLLKSAVTHLKSFQDIKKDFQLMAKEVQQNLNEYQMVTEVTFKEVNSNCQTLCQDFCQVKETFAEYCDYTEKNLSEAQTKNTKLKRNLLEYENTISALEKEERFLSDELNEIKQVVQELYETKRVLEEQCAAIQTEANNSVESMKTENAKISLELKDATDKLDLLQQEAYDAAMKLKSKDTKIDELFSNISSYQSRLDHLLCLHKESIAVRDKEIESKEEALLKLQSKIENLTSEAKDSKKKMREIIDNLQEVRSSQDAVLVAQKATLKEKCLYIQELQKQFDSVKETLKKELEDEQSSRRELQVKLSKLEDEINDRNKAMEEMQEKLRVTSSELEASRDRCRVMDANQTEIINLCQKLQYPTKNLNSTIVETCSDFEILDLNSRDMSQNECTDEKTKDVLDIIKMTLDELHASQKVILYLSLANTELKKDLAEQQVQIENGKKDAEEVRSLKNKVREMDIIAQKRNDYLYGLIRNKESLKDALQTVFVSRDDLDNVLVSSQEKWNETLTKFRNLLQIESPVCDEFKQLQAKKKSLDDELLKYHMDHLENVKYISDILWEKFLWTEKKLYDTYLCSVHEKECLDILTSVEDQFSDEKVVIETELEKNKTSHEDLMKLQEKVQSFVALASSCENSLKSKEIVTQSDIEKKLRGQINQLTKEKDDLKSKMDGMRSRNVKLERNMDDLRVEIKKLKSAIDSEEVQSLKSELECVKEQCEQLHKEKDKSSETAKQHLESELKKMQTLYEQKLEDMKQNLHREKSKSSETAKQDLESQLKDVHASYERKLEDMKQKMKKAYNEQMAKLNNEQEKIVREKLHSQMESMCQKQREEINRYKTHVGDLSSQLWRVGEKLLIEQQQKQEAMQCLKELQTKFKENEANQQVSTFSQRTTSMEKQQISPENAQEMTHKLTLITEETIQRRRSIRNIAAMSNAFKVEDEEEVFDNVYLADMKKGICLPNANVERLSVLQMRNAQCKPHLKSSYPTEMQFLSTNLTEEDIKTGSVMEDIFNDSLSQSLLPEQKVKKKDRYQTSYKKPGPPTPSKNGGRLSLQGNELRSPNSRILRERNVDRRTTTTPRTLRQLLTLKRQDENAPSTPKGRRLSSLFRKSRMQ